MYQVLVSNTNWLQIVEKMELWAVAFDIKTN
jgi:hypothetical protein